MGIGIAAFVIMIVIAPYRLHRVTTFLHPELDPQGIGYQINQAYLAIGSGGIFGLGLGHSRQKFQYLPEVHADSIFAIMAEECGFLIIIGYLILLYLFLRRMFALAKNCTDEYERLIVAGIATWIGAQSFLNIGAIAGLLPLTGVPLPLVSHGGTSLLSTLAAIGIVLQITKTTTIKNV
jgi:cell division protein FtsW